MKLFFASLASARCASAVARETLGVTPVQKVVQLMEGMLEKGKAEKHAEEIQFSAYKQFCDDVSVEKARAIEQANERIDVLKADIGKHTADAERLSKEVSEHEADIAAWTGDSQAATNVRSMEKATYDETHRDYSESISALERAIAVLQKQAYDRKQAEAAQESGATTSFAQLVAVKSLKLIPVDAKRTIDAFLEQEPAATPDESPAQESATVDPQPGARPPLEAPAASGYEFASSGVIEMLKKLHEKFAAERTELEKEEANSQHAFALLQQDLTAQIDQANKDVSAKSESKAKHMEARATAEGDLVETTASLDADKKYLGDLTATCEQKSSEFESRQQLRAEELEAVQKAIEIISSNAVAGNAQKHLPTLVQDQTSLAQILERNSARANQAKVATYLRGEASRLKSRVLASIGERASEDNFEKVKNMIKDLIVRLMEQANQEAEHKGWCDTELSTNEQTRTEKTDAVETLHAEIDQLDASIAKLADDIAGLTKAVADLDAAMATATTLRQEEQTTNAASVKDAQDAQTAVAQAVTVLKEFYAKAGEAVAFVQQQPEAPEIFNTPYKGMAAESGGVVGMLEIIQSDFARLESETKAAEATSQKEFDQFMTDSKTDKAAKQTDIEHKTAKKQDESQALVTKREDLEGTQKELDAALAYFDKLKPSCVNSGVSYEDRVARRKEEIESLQEALRILNGEDIA